ncbi:MAG: hypothetical protein ABR923_02755 [Terracidiphilus sp.]
MYSFRRLALLLALVLPAMHALIAQTSSSSSDAAVVAADGTRLAFESPAPATPAPATPTQESPAQAAPAPAQAQPQPNQPQISVQARIRARREQRRAAAIHEVYDHLYEVYVGGGYLRTTPGATLQRVNEYDWNTEFTRYFSERLGVTIDGRGYYGTPFIEPLQGTPPAGSVGLTKPAISQYGALAGPTYRFYLQPKYSISVRVMGGFAHGNFTGDTNGYGTLGVLYPDASTFAASASVYGEYNVAPNLGIRVAPEYYLTGFGSTTQNGLGFSAGIVYRFGKQ